MAVEITRMDQVPGNIAHYFGFGDAAERKGFGFQEKQKLPLGLWTHTYVAGARVLEFPRFMLRMYNGHDQLCPMTDGLRKRADERMRLQRLRGNSRDCK